MTTRDDPDPVQLHRQEVEQARDQLMEWIVDRLVPIKGDPTGWRRLRHYQETKDELTARVAGANPSHATADHTVSVVREYHPVVD